MREGPATGRQPKEALVPRIELDQPAPDFTLDDHRGNPVRLADFRGRQRVLLVLNRGFT